MEIIKHRANFSKHFWFAFVMCYELLKLGMLWLGVWETFRPVWLSCSPCASLASVGLQVMRCKTTHLILPFEWWVLDRCNKASSNSSTIIVIASPVWVSPWPWWKSSTGNFAEFFSLEDSGCFSSISLSFRMSREIFWVSVLKIRLL